MKTPSRFLFRGTFTSEQVMKEKVMEFYSTLCNLKGNSLIAEDLYVTRFDYVWRTDNTFKRAPGAFR